LEPLFTPGPWRLDDPIHGTVRADYHCIDAGRGYLVAGGNGFGIAGFMTIHDARLITAAPDLLQSLQDMYAAFVDCVEGGPEDELMKFARAAISKALGGSHG